MSTAARVAASINKHPWRWAIGAAATLLALGGAGIKKDHDARQAAADKHALHQAEQNRAAAERQARDAAKRDACKNDLAGITTRAQEHVKHNEPAEAIHMLVDCLPFAPGSAQEKLLQQARALQAKHAEAARLAAATRERERKANTHPAIGMTPSEVTEGSWGKPDRVNRTTTATSTREQWVYPNGYLYFVNGRLTAIQD